MLALLDSEGEQVVRDPLEETIALLKTGRIVAIKGLGGFHLAVDATNTEAVKELRRRKKRFEKPFAVMVASSHDAEEFCVVGLKDRVLLESPQRPIVLLKARSGSGLSDAIAPCNPELGIFLPYTPVQHLLFAHGQFRALVMTSANLSEEPICVDNEEAVGRLHSIADFFLVHNRDIRLRCDDSVVRSVQGRTTILRRSRGYVPAPIALKDELPAILAVGGELKNAICLTKGRNAFLGQHVGDLENLAAYSFFRESIAHLKNILQIEPEAIAYDLHPGYLSTQWTLQQKAVRTIGVQHHHAHVASCMAENHLSGPVIGVVLDGTGYGTDAQIWGGEILVADFRDFRRAAHLEYVPMPGAVQAIREPWRMAVAHLLHADPDCFEQNCRFLKTLPRERIDIARQMAARQVRSPLTSSCGRLFDAVAALIGLRTHVSFEAQAAMELEACCEDAVEDSPYTLTIRKEDDCFSIGTARLFQEILDDLYEGVPKGTISLRFHKGLIAVFANLVQQISRETGIRQVCLSGGCFLNLRLSVGLEEKLKLLGFKVFTQSQVPPGDGGLGLGQAVIAAHHIHQGL